MTHSTDSTYLLGETSGEHGRLIRQAHIFGPFTERLFREAGVDTGQRVLDVGSGVGDVALLAARLVGPSGTVIGVERDPNTVATASSRASAAGLANVRFIQGEVGSFAITESFDAVVGRFIIEFLPDADAAMRSLASLLRPGGVMAFQDACAHGHGARTLPGHPGGGAALANDADRGSHRRRPKHRSIRLRYFFHAVAAYAGIWALAE